MAVSTAKGYFGSRKSCRVPGLFPGREARAEIGYGPDYGAVWKPRQRGEGNPTHAFSPGRRSPSRDTGHGSPSARGSLPIPSTRGGGGAAILSTRGGAAPPPSATGHRRAIPSTTSRIRRLLVAGIPRVTTASLHLRHPSPLILSVAVASDSGTSTPAALLLPPQILELPIRELG